MQFISKKENMASLACTTCEGELLPGAAACPSCGQKPAKKKRLPVWLVVLGILWLAGGIWALPGGGLRKSIDQFKTDARSEAVVELVAEELKEYEAAKRKGDSVQTCFHAMTIAEFYLLGKDKKNHQIWDEIRKSDCGGDSPK